MFHYIDSAAIARNVATVFDTKPSDLAPGNTGTLSSIELELQQSSWMG